jgi:serine/threonine protein kinase
MLVLSLSPQNAVIYDYGKAVRMRSTKKTRIGPEYSLAPKIYGDILYTSKIDVWAWAYAAAQILCHYRFENNRITELRHANIL